MEQANFCRHRENGEFCKQNRLVLIIYSPSRSPSTSIRNRQNQRARYISGRAYWDLVETQIKISIGRDRQVEPNTDLDLSRDQIPISETGYIPSELIFRYGYWWRGLWLGEFVILSVLRILLGFCIYAASQIHDCNHLVQLLVHYQPYQS